jgi:hypothetical protein
MVERIKRDVRITTIDESTSEICTRRRAIQFMSMADRARSCFLVEVASRKVENNRIHLDVSTADRAGEVWRLLALGGAASPEERLLGPVSDMALWRGRSTNWRRRP